MTVEPVGGWDALVDAICDEIGEAPTPPVREALTRFVEQLDTADEAVEQADGLLWRTHRLAVLAPHLDPRRIAEAARAAAPRPGVGLGVLRSSDLVSAATPPEADPDPTFGDLAQEYLELALEGEHDRAVDMVLASGLPGDAALVRILAPAQEELARRWEHGTVSVAEEDDFCRLTARVLALLRGHPSSTAPHGRSVYLAAVGHGLRTAGSDILVHLLEDRGWQVVRVREPVYAGEVVAALADEQPDVLVLTVDLRQHLDELRAVLAALEADERTRPIRVVVGGQPFRADPALAARLGADEGSPDLVGLVAACERAVGLILERPVNDVTREMVHPLETMLGLAALLQDDDSLSHRQRDLAGRIIRAGGRLLSVVEDLGHGLVVVHGGPDERSSSGLLDLDDLVESLLVRHSGKAAQRDIVMRQIRIPPNRGRVLVQGDVSQLERLVDTLLDNAVTVTPASGVITVRVKRADDVASVAVADEGPAIPRESREAIFDADRATSSVGATDVGPWRGLAVCRRIAEQHGGTVTATSDHRGAVFTVELPMSERMLLSEPRTGPSFPPLTAVPDRRTSPPTA